jgi:NTE family protein
MEKNLGLVLSGGGAKGAYQTGMFCALEERGIAPCIAAMAGTSIGAFAAAAYAVGGTSLMREMLNAFGSVCHPEVSEDVLQKAKQEVQAGQVTLDQFCTEKRFRACDTTELRRWLFSALPDSALKSLRVPVTVCVYSLDRGRPEYYLLNGLEPEQQRALILASGSLPMGFPPVCIDGSWYLDGGVRPVICPNGSAADKIPLTAFRGKAPARILVDFLIASDTVDNSWVSPETRYLELRPSEPLEAYPGAGTLDFTPAKLAENEQRGYRDTIALLKANPNF